MNNTNTNNLLCRRIMRRVYFIWFTKKIAPYLLIELTLFASFLYLIGHYVFVSKVLQYASQILANNSVNPAVWSAFAWNTFIGTELIVQLSVLGVLAMAVLLLKNFITSFAQLVLSNAETKLVG
ncbi:MAG: hypothetical protein NT078_01700 [Candidatus Azambacteria bacterium]|nr:hypothetical protein [Candidatus Azambacteria bacterium]